MYVHSEVLLSNLNILFIISNIILSFILYLYFIKYNPTLSLKGNDLWRQIAGFKLYLEKAEKYRMQNLTPEIFEKYLPYAMIFGIEKKWAKNFESIVTQNPNWYHSGAYAVGVHSGLTSTNTFSVSGFSTSFSTSFSSAFSSSGASGSSGGSGGGGGGGGSGGGGGGAS
jgi:uncharacterized membrane protein